MSENCQENDTLARALELLERQEELLKNMERELKAVRESTERMDDHIDFVHRCYVAFRFPLEVGRIITSRFLAPIMGIRDSKDSIAPSRDAPLLLDSVPPESEGGDEEYRTLVSRVEASALPLLSKEDLKRCEKHNEAPEKNEKNIL